MQLKERLSAVVEILKASNIALDDDPQAEGTGFLSYKPEVLAEAVLSLCEILPPPTKAMDLGCGNGGFALLAAAAGYETYAIEISPYLIEKAQENYKLCVERNLISKNTICKFTAGNFYPHSEKERFEQFRKNHNENLQSMPWEDTQDPYQQLNIELSEIQILYTWSWPTQSRYLYNFLERRTDPSTIFILPAYIRYTQGEHMNAMLREPNTLILSPLAKVADIFIGRRPQNEKKLLI